MNPCPSEGKQRSLARCKVLSHRHSFAHATLAVLGETETLSLEELHGGVLRRHGAAIELSCALAIGGADLGGQGLRLILEVANFVRACWDVAGLLLVLVSWILCVAPWRVHRAVWVAAIIVVAQAVAP